MLPLRALMRPSTTQRGYGGGWAKLRAKWQRRIDAGELVRCRRGRLCKRAVTLSGGLTVGGPIGPADVWDLGHDDRDRSLPPHPEHSGCNRATTGRGGSRKRPQEPHPGMT